MIENAILIVDDDPVMLDLESTLLTKAGFVSEQANCGRACLDKLSRKKYDLVLLDLGLPDMTGFEVLKEIKRETPDLIVIIVTATNDVRTAVQAIKLGAFDYLTKPLDYSRFILTVRNTISSISYKDQADFLRSPTERRNKFPALIGSGPAMTHIFKAIDKVAQSRISVLIRGESGTGKELAARAIHQNSSRSAKKFIAVNCAGIPETLLESLLFGHEKGAFTGALSRRIGKFELAHNSTLFLDEIGDMQPDLQAKILRVLQEREIERVGSNETIPVDVRIISATNRNLEKLMNKGRFREDLYYRIAAFPVFLPPLRDRLEDIGELSEFILRKIGKEENRTGLRLTNNTLEILHRHKWPGNVRELENILNRAALMADTNVIQTADLPLEIRDLKAVDERLMEESQSIIISISELEKRAIRRALIQTNGNLSEAAKGLGFGRSTLYRKVREYGIQIPD